MKFTDVILTLTDNLKCPQHLSSTLTFLPGHLSIFSHKATYFIVCSALLLLHLECRATFATPFIYHPL